MVGTAQPQPHFFTPGKVSLRAAHPQGQELDHPLRPSVTSNLQVAGTMLSWVLQVLHCLAVPPCYLPRHDGDPMKEPFLHLCLSVLFVSAVWKKINIAVCC